MPYFPQLSSGATGQFPVARQRTARTVVNQSWDGYQVKLADPGAAITEWHLSFEELSDQELAALEALFQAVEGSLTPFTFLDPADNLLAWSEQQSEPVWQADPLLTLTVGISDPFGGTAAYRVSNPTGATLILQQSINAPASLDYCLSVYACSEQSPRLWLVRGATIEAVEIGPQWTRATSAGQLQDTSDTISFGVALDPGSAVNVFGFQAEVQPAASLYKQTAETGGVYPNARFRDDALTFTAAGPGRYSCELDIVNVEYL
ncbi:MAG TPA: hypothetical protein VMU80_00040 [Bryobacteraceae bacterium]|nr:hypothetical protein [Bryobacteraceae bacterium]